MKSCALVAVILAIFAATAVPAPALASQPSREMTAHHKSLKHHAVRHHKMRACRHRGHC